MHPLVIAKEANKELEEFVESELIAVETNRSRTTMKRAIARLELGDKVVCTSKNNKNYLVKLPSR